MKRQWTNEELISHFTLLPKELDLIGESKADHTLLGFAALLKYFQVEVVSEGHWKRFVPYR